MESQTIISDKRGVKATLFYGIMLAYSVIRQLCMVRLILWPFSLTEDHIGQGGRANCSTNAVQNLPIWLTTNVSKFQRLKMRTFCCKPQAEKLHEIIPSAGTWEFKSKNTFLHGQAMLVFGLSFKSDKNNLVSRHIQADVKKWKDLK